MKKNAFTLLELLMVTLIIAIIAGGVVMSGSSGIDETKKDIASYRQAIVYKALIKFKKDMGYYPGDGPLEFSNLDNDLTYVDEDNNLITYLAMESDFVGTGEEDIQNEVFENGEANFYQLLYEPKDKSDLDKWSWDPDYKRGWDGPYLDATFTRIPFNDWLTIKFGKDYSLTGAQITQEEFLWSNSITAYQDGNQSTFFYLIKVESSGPEKDKFSLVYWPWGNSKSYYVKPLP